MRKLKLANNAYLEIEVEDSERGKVLSISGYVSGSHGYGGQCQNSIAEDFIGTHSNLSNEKQAMLGRLIEIWDRYHLNDMNAGTEKQMKALKGKNLSYENALEYLESINLKIDDGYKYGTAWLFEEIPSSVLKEVEEIIENW